MDPVIRITAGLPKSMLRRYKFIEFSNLSPIQFDPISKPFTKKERLEFGLGEKIGAPRFGHVPLTSTVAYYKTKIQPAHGHSPGFAEDDATVLRGSTIIESREVDLNLKKRNFLGQETTSLSKINSRLINMSLDSSSKKLETCGSGSLLHQFSRSTLITSPS